jgi:hypothetical protein
METGQEANKEGQGKSSILTEEIPKYGRVSMLFYIPENVKDRDIMVQLIKENGGNIVKFHECFTYQIGTPNNTKEEDYYQGTVFSFQWIVESIEAKKLVEKSKYILANYQNGKDFPFSKKKIKYTIREVIIIYNWISGRKSQASRKTWESLGNDGILHCRTRESLKNFWKKWRNSELEECINEMLTKDTRYCHNYYNVVLPHQEPDEEQKKGLKRTKSEVNMQEEEDIGEGEGDVLKSKNKKRKIQKKKVELSKDTESDRVKTSDNKAQKIEEVKEVSGIIEGEGEEEEEEEVQEEEKENKKEVQRAKKPDVPLEDNSVDGVIEGSGNMSDIGFPSLGGESDREE